MAVNPTIVPRAERTGLRAVPCGHPYGPEQLGDSAEIVEGPVQVTLSQYREALQRLDLGRVYRDLASACAGADLLISASLQGVAGWLHEATGIPWINATIFPMEFRHAGDPPHDPGPATGQRADLFAYRNAVRAELGLPAVRDEQWRVRYWSDRLILVASSWHFSQPLLSEWPHAHMTGFWFDEQAARGENGDPQLDAFLDGGDEPLVLTFSSQVVKDAARVTALHAEAASRLGRRLIVQKGWAGLGAGNLPTPVDPGRVYIAGHVRHEALFPRVAAVIHQGGVGTTARAMQCGRPMLVEPYVNDQFFNAGRAQTLGVGGVVDPHGLTVEHLRRVLDEIVLTDETRRRAEQLGSQIRAEDGLSRACDLIEAELAA